LSEVFVSNAVVPIPVPFCAKEYQYLCHNNLSELTDTYGNRAF
jgi:hypothetical protein